MITDNVINRLKLSTENGLDGLDGLDGFGNL